MLSLIGLSSALVLPPPAVVEYRLPVQAPLIEQRAQFFPGTTDLLAGGENWYTPSSVLDTDCEGNPVRRGQPLSKECIYQKKVAEIRDRQAAEAQKAQEKFDQMQAMEKAKEQRAAAAQAAAAAKAAAREAHVAESQAAKAAGSEATPRAARPERTGEKAACFYCGN